MRARLLRIGRTGRAGVSSVLVPLALALATGARPARAAPTSKLTYVRGPGAEACGDESVLRQAVADRLGYDPFFPWAERTVVAVIDRSGREFTGRVRILDARGRLLGERALDAATRRCDELLASLALAISVAIDDLDAVTTAPSETPSSAQPDSTPAPPVHPESPSETAEPRPPRSPPPSPTSAALRPFVRAGAVGAAGIAPSPNLGFTAAVPNGPERRGPIPPRPGPKSAARRGDSSAYCGRRQRRATPDGDVTQARDRIRALRCKSRCRTRSRTTRARCGRRRSGR